MSVYFSINIDRAQGIDDNVKCGDASVTCVDVIIQGRGAWPWRRPSSTRG